MPHKTPLFDWHRAHGGKIVEFAGWSMPVQYASGSTNEHHLVRRSAGLFDISHMGQFTVRGRGAMEYLEKLITSRMASLADHQSAYGLLCRDDGGVVDDIFVYRLPDEWFVVVNAANVANDLRWMREHLPAAGVVLEDVSDRFAMYALQGPAALKVTEGLCDLKSLERFASVSVSIGGTQCLIGRTGYTGEDGIELFVPVADSLRTWELLLAEAERVGIECGPIGLAARDSLRFEPGFPLYGHELNEKITPIEARLKWACDLEKEFIGASALRGQVENGVSTRLATIRLIDRGMPRQGFTIFHEDREAGEVASGMYAPTVDAYCANVFVPPGTARVGTELEVEIRDKRKTAVVVKRPLYTPAYR